MVLTNAFLLLLLFICSAGRGERLERGSEWCRRHTERWGKDGAESHVQETALLQHQVEQGKEGQDPRLVVYKCNVSIHVIARVEAPISNERQSVTILGEQVESLFYTL